MDGFEFCLLSREIAEGRVYSVPVVVFLDVSEQIAHRFFVGRPLSLINELHFERIKEAFHCRCDQRTTLATLTVKIVATARTLARC